VPALQVRQGRRTTGPICPDALAATIVPWPLRALEAWFNGDLRALAQAGVFAPTVTGIVEATELETTAPYAGCGQVARQRQSTDTWGQVHAIEGTV
jgi:hypothetical protein